MDSTPPRGSSSLVVMKGDDQERQSSYSPLPSSSTNLSFAQSQKRPRGDATATPSNTYPSRSSLPETAQKKLHREEPVLQPSYSPTSISPREGTVFDGEDDFGARHPSMTEDGHRSNEDGSGLHSPVFDSEFPRNDFDVEDTAGILSDFDYSEQQIPPVDTSARRGEDLYGTTTQQAKMEESERGRNIFLEAPFFAQSHGFTIHNSQFYACSGHGFNQAREQDVPSAAFRVIPRDELRTLSVICTRKGSRFNNAERKGSEVVVQVFEGSAARKSWQKTLNLSSRRILNAHFLDIVGISPTSDCSSDPHYIVFDGADSTHRLIASMLRKGAGEATAIGLRAVHGITSGLDYISKTIHPLSELGIDEFDAFSVGSGYTRLTFTPNAFDGHSTLVNQLEVTDVEICNSFIRKIFNNANHAIHGDEADQHIKEDFTNSRRLTPQMESTGDPEISLIAKRPPRREIIWNAFGFSKSSLSDISQTYENVIFNDSIQLPRRLGRSVIGYRRACSCEGYSREEITFTPDAFRNAVLIYQQPSPNERCGLCGELLPTPTIIIPQPSNHTRDEDDYGRDVQMKKPAASSRDSTLPVSTGISNHRPMSPEALADLAEKELENRKMIAEHEQEHVTSRKGSFSVRDQLSSLFQSGRGSSSRNSSWGFLGRSRSRRYIDARTGSEVDRHGRPVYRV